MTYTEKYTRDKIFALYSCSVQIGRSTCAEQKMRSDSINCQAEQAVQLTPDWQDQLTGEQMPCAGQLTLQVCLASRAHQPESAELH